MPGPKEVRCNSRILGIFTADGLLEIKCPSRGCGAGKGVVVFHYVNIETGQVVSTKKYQDPDRIFPTGKKR